MLACVDGRVQQLAVDGGAAALTSLPANLTRLDRLATLGKPCPGMQLGWRATRVTSSLRPVTPLLHEQQVR
jgi:hypothetical protein